MISLGGWIRHNAEWAGERLALDLGEARYTYRQMNRAVARRRNLLVEVLRAEPGDRIASLGFNACEVPLLLFACARAGCVFMPLNNRLAVPELRAIVAHSEVRYLCDGGSSPRWPPRFRRPFPRCGASTWTPTIPVCWPAPKSATTTTSAPWMIRRC